jgi:hypothetical protein
MAEPLNDQRREEIRTMFADRREFTTTAGRRAAAELLGELDRLHTWPGLMSLLDEHYPADVQLGPDDEPGPRILALVREVDRLTALVETLAAEKAEHFVDTTTMFRGMNTRDGQLHLDIVPAREILLTWCAAVRAMLDEHGAENYTESAVTMPALDAVHLDIQDGRHPEDSYTLTLQRRHRPTAHDLRLRAERERDEAEEARAATQLALNAEFERSCQFRKERDELAAMLPPLCAHCGERNRDGCYSEHDNSWMCAPCYVAAAQGEER